jgi:hypothetical protein
MSSIDKVTGAAYEKTIRIGDHGFRVRVGSMKMLGHVRAFLERNPPKDPIEDARDILSLPGLDTDLRRSIVANLLAERKSWPPDPHIAPAQAFDAMCHIEGGAEELIFLILRESTPTRGTPYPEDELREIARSCDSESFMVAAMTAGRAATMLSLENQRGSLAVVDRNGVRILALRLLEALELDVAPDRALAAADAIPLSDVGMSFMIEVNARDGAAVPKGEAVTVPPKPTRKTTKASTSEPPTP